jgi:HSP20 family protein
MRLIRYSYPSSRSLTPGSGRFSPSPWSGLETEIDRLFTSALGELANPPVTRAPFPVDLYEDKGHTYVRAELPGVSRGDLTIEVVNGYLTIAAVRKTPASEGQPEQSCSFNRSLRLNDEVQADQIAAAYENGVLTITLPKREEATPKKITVPVK